MRILVGCQALFPLLLVSAAMAADAQVGICLPETQSFPTISQAVAGVTPGSTVFVCPGEYPEQIVITQPLTLHGVRIGNASGPIIKVPATGLTKNVLAPTNGAAMYFQILVQGTESEEVTISNIAIDGSSSANAAISGWIEGIYYQNSSGAINHVAVYAQKGNGYGFGIFLEGTTPGRKNVAVVDSSVHDFDSEGIRTNGSVVPSLVVEISSNEVLSSTVVSDNPVYGEIDVQGAKGAIADNRVITYPAPAGVSTGTGIAFPSGVIVARNTVVNTGIWGLGDGNLITSNQVLWGGGITVSGRHNTVRQNTVVGYGISFNCSGTANTVIDNSVNDSAFGIEDHPGNIIAPNTYSNVATILTPPC